MRRRMLTFKITIICVTCSVWLHAQTTQDIPSEASARLMFYNAENLFDVRDDSLTHDEEFLPQGTRYWTYSKLNQKLNHLYKTIVAVGEWQPPAVVGLCEIENRYVLQRLVEDTPLQQLHYQIIHKDSPDKRGIDVALLYREADFLPVAYEAIRINFPDQPYKTTRDVLYVKGVLLDMDTVHLFVNHWPSRRGGQQASAPNRNFVASIVKQKTDSIFSVNPNANIIIMGDFNDGPEDASLATYLNAKPKLHDIMSNQLYNMMRAGNSGEEGVYGTLKYQGQWDLFDQFIVSGALLQKKYTLQIPGKRAKIFTADFLLQEDKTYLGKKPFRTYAGFKYQNGFSDHLPVFIEITTPPLQLTKQE